MKCYQIYQKQNKSFSVNLQGREDVCFLKSNWFQQEGADN